MISEYSRLRKAFLDANPLCEWYLQRLDLSKLLAASTTIISEDGAWVIDDLKKVKYWVPRSTEIHHKKGRGKYLLDTSTWMALSQEGHRHIHDNPKEAYEKGWMLPRT